MVLEAISLRECLTHLRSWTFFYGGIMSSAPRSTSLMDENTILRSVTRIAHEILEQNKGASNLALVGIVKRGDILARLLAKKIEEIEGVALDVGTLDISFYRDDVATRIAPEIQKTDIPFDVDGKIIVLVDDVLYTGRTIRAALDAVMDFGRPQAIRLAVMVDRGHRELPIRADYVGKNIPSSSLERVKLFIKPLDEFTSVEMFNERSAR